MLQYSMFKFNDQSKLQVLKKLANFFYLIPQTESCLIVQIVVIIIIISSKTKDLHISIREWCDAMEDRIPMECTSTKTDHNRRILTNKTLRCLLIMCCIAIDLICIAD